MDSNVGPSGEITTELIPGPNHPKPHESFGQTLVLVLVIAGAILLPVQLASAVLDHVYLPLIIVVVAFLFIWLLVHYAPTKKG